MAHPNPTGDATTFAPCRWHRWCWSWCACVKKKFTQTLLGMLYQHHQVGSSRDRNYKQSSWHHSVFEDGVKYFLARKAVSHHQSPSRVLRFFPNVWDQGTPQHVISGMQVAQRDIQATCGHEPMSKDVNTCDCDNLWYWWIKQCCFCFSPERLQLQLFQHWSLDHRSKATKEIIHHQSPRPYTRRHSGRTFAPGHTMIFRVVAAVLAGAPILILVM